MFQELIRNMSERDPARRQSAEVYLAQERNRVFPEYFYSFLQPYMHIFSAAPILSPDEKISRYSDLSFVQRCLNSHSYGLN
jgi:phosphoinositide-3-kinase regulatory subunit 4